MINTPLTLPCGSVLTNRLSKAATTERLCQRKGIPNDDLIHLYDRWADTRAGLLITGNIMVDRSHLESAGNVVIDSDFVHPKMKAWAAAGKKHNNHIWVQISHSGRQTSRFVNLRPGSASDVQLKKMGVFGKPRAFSSDEIERIIEGFVIAAKVSKGAGFTGVQIHAAHGYLLSQFLSPITNRRKDEWGGSLENRARMLLAIIDKVRKVVGKGFPIGVKLNSADFQRGGFSEDESITVINWLEEAGVDLLEISGGTYEKVVFFSGKDAPQKDSTRQREAYFIEFAEKVKKTSSIPLMVTGGFRTYEFVNYCLGQGSVDVVGMARPFITNLHQIKGFSEGEIKSLAELTIKTGVHELDDSAEGGFYARNIIRIAKGKEVKFDYSNFGNAMFLIKHEFSKGVLRRLLGSK